MFGKKIPNYDEIADFYLPYRGEGKTKATQIVTAVNKLVYKWFNDGDVYDNTHHIHGWYNDLSSCANWLHSNTTPSAADILNRIKQIRTDDEYEELLFDLAAELYNIDYLEEQDKLRKIGTIYDCDGVFKFKRY